MSKTTGRAALFLALAMAPTTPLAAQWSTTYEQFYLQASHNWQFRTRYSHADRLFNAFDFGHAILYETLWRKPNASADELEIRRYDQLTTRVLVNPPRLPLEEAAIEPKYAQLAPEAKVMFDWAHLLHRQLYDVLADERMDWPARDAEIARLIRYYKSRPDLAFSSRPKTMRLMQEQPFSLAFRQKYPKFNGLIWGYHWLQMGLYEPLMVGKSVAEKQAGVRATVSRFFQMLADPPRTLPHQMPMTVPVAPTFAARYPEAAIIFDNLHSMHDVVSDILTNPKVPRDRKRAEILKAARAYRDDTTEVMTVAAWKIMSEHMGIENMGGPSVGFVPALPTPTVTAGAVMQHDSTGAMIGFAYGSAVGGEHLGHTPDPHAGHVMPAAPAASADSAISSFLHGMIGHHRQAIEMAALIAGRSSSAPLALLGERITVSQRDEIAGMEQYLKDRQLPAAPAMDPAHMGHDMPGMPAMPGMLSAAQVDSLRAAKGATFDRQFLEAMIRHHEGAITMVDALRKVPGALQEPRLFQFITDVVADQTAEIRRMQSMLQSLRTR